MELLARMRGALLGQKLSTITIVSVLTVSLTLVSTRCNNNNRKTMETRPHDTYEVDELRVVGKLFDCKSERDT